MSNGKNELRKLISEGRASEVLESLKLAIERYGNHTLQRDLSALSGQWHSNEQSFHNGEKPFEQYEITKNRMTSGLLDIVAKGPDWVVDTTGGPVIITLPSPDTPAQPKPDLWKRLGYIGLIVGILAGVVKIVEYFQKPDVAPATEQAKAKTDSLPPAPTMQTSGKQSPIINAPGGNVTISYGSEEPEKPVEEKAKTKGQ
jgi:hypothetical protein